MSKIRWYVVNVYAGSENKVSEYIDEQVEKNDLSNQIIDILIPTEKFTKIVKGHKVKLEKNAFPGYVLVNMELTDQTWHIVSTCPKVTSFLGSGGKPTPITKKEVERLLSNMQDREAKNDSVHHFAIGEELQVIDGPFSTFNGFVEEIYDEKERLKVSVMIFGRDTPVELGFSQVKKL